MVEVSIDLIVWLQANLPWLVPVAHVFTLLGDEDFYVIAFPLLYWSVSPRIGVRVGMMLLLSAGLNEALKLVFATPRPFWVSEAVEAHVVETSFGVPSGHAQNAVVVWGSLAYSIAKTWALAVAVALVLAIGMSRWAVGVHAVEDTLSGWLVGALLLAVFLRAEPGVRAWLADRSIGVWVAASFVAPLGLVALGTVAWLLRRDLTVPGTWQANVAAAAPELAPFDPVTVTAVVTPAGALCGVGLGLALLARTRGAFSPSSTAWKRVLCYPVGLVGVLVLWMGLGAVFPGGDAPFALALRFLRYTLVGMWITGLAPLLFLGLRLADQPRRLDTRSAT
jgi:membrane-associated phospholipid phosphatase